MHDKDSDNSCVPLVASELERVFKTNNLWSNITNMIIYKDESYKIVGAAFNVYNKLGHGFLEAVYQEALEMEFKKQGIPYDREKELKITYDGVELKTTYKADFVCYGKIIVELKAVSYLEDSHRAQVYNYLHATGFKLGLLMNFGNSDELEKERIVI